MNAYESIFRKIHEICNKHRRNHPENGDSKQMCCMWSTNDPPDVIEDTEPLNDIQAVFNIIIDEDDALDLYDMDLEEASKRLEEIQQKQN